MVRLVVEVLVFSLNTELCVTFLQQTPEMYMQLQLVHTTAVSFVDADYGVCCQRGAATVGQISLLEIFLLTVWAGFLARQLEGLIWNE